MERALDFKKWLETAGEDHTQTNDGAFGRSRYAASSYPKEPKDQDRKEPLLGFMKKKMKKK